MQVASDMEGRAAARPQERDFNELKKQILKLRWIGREVEAERMLRALGPADRERLPLLFEPLDTD